MELPPPADLQECEERLRLGPGIYSAVDDNGELSLVRGNRSQKLGRVGSGRRAALRRLAAGPCSMAELRACADADQLPAFLDALGAGGWLMTTVCHRGGPLYTVEPLEPPSAKPDAARTDLVLSRFAVQYRDGDQMVIESPLAWGAVRIHDPAAATVPAALATPLPADATPGALPGAVAARLLRDLRWTGLAVSVPSAEDGDLRLRQWSPHELWSHRRSRMGGRADRGYGRTMWANGEFDPLPARRMPPFAGPAIDLYRPDLDALRRGDAPLTRVLEERRSIREHDDDDPICVDQLGELLYRCARVRGQWERDGVDYLDRPYPAGGAAHELELYPVIRLASGIRPGMYHYDAHDHALRPVRGPDPQVGRLLRVAARSALLTTPPQILIVIAARFGRLMWAYEEMPYALILKNVGVLCQTLHLTATSMGLAACALGGGDAAAFAEATGLDYAIEGSVGEFLLGSAGAR